MTRRQGRRAGHPGGGRPRPQRMWRRRRAARPAAAVVAAARQPIVGLITKTDTNPFFVKMKEGAQRRPTQQGLELQSFAGKQDGDNEAQVQAIENLISAGAKGILITPSDSKAIVPSIDKAKQAGMLVIALDTPTDPADAVDATFATDNYQAGLLIGQWAKAKFDAEGKQAKIAMLDLNANQVSVDVQRDQGFLEGFGIDVADNDPDRRRDRPADRRPRRDRRRRGRRPDRDGEPAAEGPVDQPGLHDQRAGRGRCVPGAQGGRQGEGRHHRLGRRRLPGRRRRQGRARSAPPRMQFPLKMAQMGVEAVAAFAKDGTKPEATEGKDFVDTGVTLITDQPQAGVDGQGHHVRHRELLGLTHVDRHQRTSGRVRVRRRLRRTTSATRSACGSSTSCTPTRSSDRSPCWSWRSSRSRS